MSARTTAGQVRWDRLPAIGGGQRASKNQATKKGYRHALPSPQSGGNTFRAVTRTARSFPFGDRRRRPQRIAALRQGRGSR